MPPRRAPVPLASGVIETPGEPETYVYRAYCRCGDLLYVGMTSNLFNRLQNHRRGRKSWERAMVRLEWDLYATREQAERAEYVALRDLNPLFNIQGAVRHARPRPLPWPRFPVEEERRERLFARARALNIGDRI